MISAVLRRRQLDLLVQRTKLFKSLPDLLWIERDFHGISLYLLLVILGVIVFFNGLSFTQLERSRSFRHPHTLTVDKATDNVGQLDFLGTDFVILHKRPGHEGRIIGDRG